MIQVCAIEPWVIPACSSPWSASAATTSAAASTPRRRTRWSDAAIDEGITLLDTSDTYGKDGGSERALGEALERPPRQGGARHQVRPPGRATWGTARRPAPRAGAATSGSPWRSRSPGSRPTTSTCTSCTRPDPVTPIDETLAALDDLVTRGQGPLHRPLELHRLADRRRRAHARSAPGARRSSPRRTTGRCLSATRSARWSRPPATSAWACSRSSRWPTACSPARSAGARTSRRTPGSPSRAGRAT